jgi:hypothetical protein
MAGEQPLDRPQTPIVSSVGHVEPPAGAHFSIEALWRPLALNNPLVLNSPLAPGR